MIKILFCGDVAAFLVRFVFPALLFVFAAHDSRQKRECWNIGSSHISENHTKTSRKYANMQVRINTRTCKYAHSSDRFELQS